MTAVDAPVDRYLAGDAAALSPPARRGLELFSSAGCSDCHRPPLYRDGLAHNNGFAARAANPDLGRAAIVGNGPGGVNIRAFKTPTLRDAARTAPYMHDGSLATLAEVVEHYHSGGRFVRGGVAQRDPLADSRVRPLGLDAQQKDDLVTFLVEGLTSFDYPRLVPPVLP